MDSCVSGVLPVKCIISISNYAIVCFVNVVSNIWFTYHPTIWDNVFCYTVICK